MGKEKPLLVYLADLAHDYFSNINHYAPLSIGYLASHSKSMLGDQVEFKLFKSATKILDEIEKRKPDLVGLSNYTWNLSLSTFVGRSIKKIHSSLPVIMGGPNISIDTKGIEGFLRSNEYVDTYCMYQSEISVYKILKFLLTQSEEKKVSNILRGHTINGCYSIFNNKFTGNSQYETPNNLDENGSPYLTGLMDPFLEDGCFPMVETNRGCPFGCTFCNWGAASLKALFKNNKPNAEISKKIYTF